MTTILPLRIRRMIMADNKIKIVGICGSHRHEQNTWYALKSSLEQIKTLGIPVETEAQLQALLEDLGL